MSRYESWQDVLDDTCERLRGSGVLQKGFKSLASNTDRILFCLQESLTQARVDEWLQVLCSARHKKFWEKAFELRSEGNLCFGVQQYREAAEYYTRSILCAPSPTACTGPNQGHAEELSLSFANRSAAWFYLGKFSLALRDIDQALEHDYPTNLRYKLHLRQAQCLLKTSAFDAAQATLTDAEMALDLSGLDSERLAKQSREIEMLRNKCSSKIPVECEPETDDEADDDDDELVQPSPHTTIPNASSALDALYSTEKGRFIVANRDLRPGDSLFVERPYASVLLPSFTKSHCHHCYRRIRAAYPCRQCSQVRYCSVSCALESWDKYHRSECGYLDLLTSVGIAHLAERVVLTAGLGLLEDFMKSRNSLECNYLPVYQLVTHEEDMHVEDLFQYSLTATLLLKFLERHTMFFATTQLSERVQDLQLRGGGGGSPSRRTSLRGQIRSECGPQLKLYVGGLLLRHIEQLICNAHAITTIQQPGDHAIEEDGVILEQEQVRVATAIYPSASLMNHSCEPNITSGFRFGSMLVVKAVRAITAGEEILNCYGPHYRRMPFQERQTALLEQYFFRCDCSACARGDVDDQILMAFKCEYCEGPLSSLESSGKAECLQCQTTQECLEKEQKAFRMHDLFVQGVQLAELESHDAALERLQRCLAVREKLLYRHNKQLMETYDMVAKCLCALQRFREAAAPLKQAIESVRYVYGKHSIELGNELLKYGDVLMNATQESFAKNGYSRELATLIGDTKRVLLQTEPIFLLHYGKAHPAIRELAEKRVKLDHFISRFKATPTVSRE
ncbi:SET and MYND domain-containing protein 4-like [Tropilaelaps mercedesae]|uniref:Protein-lysine N-methyltransferase SMYD4 n=1 Tax=Tropilaelaps mercedesae TaxID=418985 RepID=A0A1V9XX30_9ACAR|nr:SET and MYND domain-containing protein 4-like [Tropilaelaps mercedesae]